MSLFLPEPIFPVLRLEAALRDLRARSPRARANAARALPDSFTRELCDEERPPHELGAARLAAHAAHAEALRGLRHLAMDPDGLVRGLSFIARGRLADPGLLDEVRGSAPQHEAETVADAWVQECRIIALAELARFSPGPRGVERDEVLRQVMEVLGRGSPQTRFQAVAALADVAPSMARDLLATHLHGEPHPRVRAQILDVLREHGDAAPTVQASAAATVAATPAEGDDEALERFAAARLLASVSDPRGATVLIDAVSDPERRDDALEALAALPSPSIPADAVESARRLHDRRWVPAITKVRAAYLIARAVPDLGLPLLHRWGKSLRPSVREAVADAMAALETLTRRDAPRPP